MAVEISIRPADPHDLEAIVTLHVRVWRETYRALAPSEAMRRLDEHVRRPIWAEALRHASTLAAETDGRIVGFVRVGEPSHAALGPRGEIKQLYVDTTFARAGIGRALLAAGRGLLGAQGHRDVALGVVLGNMPALRFYEAQGGRVIGRYRDSGPLWPSDNLVVAWDGPERG